MGGHRGRCNRQEQLEKTHTWHQPLTLGRRSRGRQRVRWKDRLKIELQKNGRSQRKKIHWTGTAGEDSHMYFEGLLYHNLEVNSVVHCCKFLACTRMLLTTCCVYVLCLHSILVTSQNKTTVYKLSHPCRQISRSCFVQPDVVTSSCRVIPLPCTIIQLS